MHLVDEADQEYVVISISESYSPSMEKLFESTSEVEKYPSKAQFSGLEMDMLALPLGIGVGWFSTNLYCTKLDVKKAKDSTIPPVTIFCSGFFKRFFFAV